MEHTYSLADDICLHGVQVKEKRSITFGRENESGCGKKKRLLSKCRKEEDDLNVKIKAKSK